MKPVSNDLSEVKLQDFDMIVFYNPADVKSLQENFPDFEQGDIKMVSYGRSIVKAMEEAGFTVKGDKSNRYAKDKSLKESDAFVFRS